MMLNGTALFIFKTIINQNTLIKINDNNEIYYGEIYLGKLEIAYLPECAIIDKESDIK